MWADAVLKIINLLIKACNVARRLVGVNVGRRRALNTVPQGKAGLWQTKL
ncbi:MAG: hypothetical protein ABSH16_09780 [Sedimentisphaerales bacterium]